MQTNYLYIALAFTLTSVICYFTGNYYGRKNERNSQENMQRIAIIKNQNLAIDKLQKDSDIKDAAIKSYQLKNDILLSNINTIQKDILANENITNSTNHVNDYFVQPIRAAASSKTMFSNNVTAGATNGSSKTYRASDVNAAIVSGFKQCQEIRNQLIELQSVIREQVENSNRYH